MLPLPPRTHRILISVVNRIIVSRWSELAPPSEIDLKNDTGRKIGQKQLYPAADVVAVLESGVESVLLWTHKCQMDVASFPWDESDVIALLRCALTDGKSHSAEWCIESDAGPMAACDVYTVDRAETANGKPVLMKYYVKFAISKTGKVILVASCHVSRK